MASKVSPFGSIKISVPDGEHKSHKQYYLGLLLIDEAKKCRTTTERWMLISDLLVVSLLDINGLKGVSKRAKLAVAIVIVGSEDYFYFYVALKIICELGIGGIYWELQEHLLAYYCLYLIRNTYENFEKAEDGKRQLNTELSRVLPDVAPVWIPDIACQKRYCALKANIFVIADSFEKGSILWGHYDVIEAKYPFKKFRLRFINWAQKRLESQGLMNETLLPTEDDVSSRQNKSKKRKALFLSYSEVDNLLNDLNDECS